MLWYKTWLDTRSRFWIGLALLLLMACGIVAEFTQVQKVLPLVSGGAPSDDGLRQALERAVELSRTFRGFVWNQWFRQNALTAGALFAALLGSSRMFGGTTVGALFTLSLPASRRRWVVTRAATGLAELLVLIVLPSLLIALLAPVIGQHYDLGEAIVHALCVYVGVAALFGLTMLLSTMVRGYQAILIVCLIAVGLSFGDLLLHGSFFSVLSAEDYFRGGSPPWFGLGVFAAAAAALLYGTILRIERLDF